MLLLLDDYELMDEGAVPARKMQRWVDVLLSKGRGEGGASVATKGRGIHKSTVCELLISRF